MDSKNEKKGRAKSERLLTDVELQLMNAVWDLKECHIKDVQESLPKNRDLAYTSVATVMKILEKKGYLGTRKGERAYTYFPVISRQEYEQIHLHHLTYNLFRGDSKSMVMSILDHSDLSKIEIQTIRELLKERLE